MATSANSCTISSSSTCTSHHDAPKARYFERVRRKGTERHNTVVLALSFRFTSLVLIHDVSVISFYNRFTFYDLHFFFFSQTGLQCRAFTMQRELVSAPWTTHSVFQDHGERSPHIHRVKADRQVSCKPLWILTTLCCKGGPTSATSILRRAWNS